MIYLDKWDITNNKITLKASEIINLKKIIFDIRDNKGIITIFRPSESVETIGLSPVIMKFCLVDLNNPVDGLEALWYDDPEDKPHENYTRK